MERYLNVRLGQEPRARTEERAAQGLKVKPRVSVAIAIAVLAINAPMRCRQCVSSGVLMNSMPARINNTNEPSQQAKMSNSKKPGIELDDWLAIAAA